MQVTLALISADKMSSPSTKKENFCKSLIITLFLCSYLPSVRALMVRDMTIHENVGITDISMKFFE